jgi:hypothetical protein
MSQFSSSEILFEVNTNKLVRSEAAAFIQMLWFGDSVSTSEWFVVQLQCLPYQKQQADCLFNILLALLNMSLTRTLFDMRVTG